MMLLVDAMYSDYGDCNVFGGGAVVGHFLQILIFMFADSSFFLLLNSYIIIIQFFYLFIFL